MSLRAVPRPRDRSWRFDWFVSHCPRCYRPMLLPLQLVSIYGAPECRCEEMGH